MFTQGRLAGSVGGACDSGSQCCEFEPQAGCGDDLKKYNLKGKKKLSLIPPSQKVAKRRFEPRGFGLQSPRFSTPSDVLSLKRFEVEWSRQGDRTREGA